MKFLALMGRWSEHGWWYYNLVALGVKLPTGILTLLAVAGAFWHRSRIDRMAIERLQYGTRRDTVGVSVLAYP